MTGSRGAVWIHPNCATDVGVAKSGCMPTAAQEQQEFGTEAAKAQHIG